MFLKKVECSGVIERKYILPENTTKQDPGNMRWIRSESIFQGTVIGERMLSNGHSEYMGDGQGFLYSPKRFFKAYLVVYNTHRKPVRVLPEDVKIIE